MNHLKHTFQQKTSKQLTHQCDLMKQSTGKVFVAPNKISKKYNRRPLTLRRWVEQGRLAHQEAHKQMSV
jgi:hypothetical protein